MVKSIPQRKATVKNIKHEERLRYYFIYVMNIVSHIEKTRIKIRAVSS